MKLLKIKFIVSIVVISYSQIALPAKTVHKVIKHNLIYRDRFNQNVTTFTHPNSYDNSIIKPHKFNFSEGDIISLQLSSPTPIIMRNEWYDDDKIVAYQYSGKL